MVWIFDVVLISPGGISLALCPHKDGHCCTLWWNPPHSTTVRTNHRQFTSTFSMSNALSCGGWGRVLYMDAGTACPAFALVARNDAEGGKRAMLVIRGTQTSVDWTINLAETMYRYSYRSGPRGETVVNGNVHTGMMLGALGILDVYCMRQAMHTLVDNGYDLKIVGHSLGSGTAALIAIELKNGLFLRALSNSPNSELTADLPRVTAVGYGTPPVVDEAIADAIIADDLMVRHSPRFVIVWFEWGI